ncbi:lipoyl protein ligase domain-containing protein [Candidatus Formimonas warabiya]|uniref:BPL/LPL catalytic domain-containing protein n=1 Tax=Formimonas warabiya TaxID=1761012 RepID=A0A3G1KTQ9_FORW1|nr:DUF116 domain-containing protein [Candidatus Formimonas warabiya]ATW25836.1 hypothetical protein DCMF_14635 [Candidatus Formimonas warabiya]
MSSWRLLDTGIRSAAENMALDQVILSAKARHWVPNTLRFLQFYPSALVGFHQAVEQEIRVDYCRTQGIEINRRITGGGGLYWDQAQLGWEIFAQKDEAIFPGKIEDLYRKLCEAVIRGLKDLGIQAKFRPRNDIEINHRKISGTGGTELGGAFLFQGSLLIDFDVDTMLRVLRIPTEKLQDKEIQSVKERVTCLKSELGYLPPLDQIKALITSGFEEVLGVDFTPGPLSPEERNLLDQALPKFQSASWIFHTRRSPVQRQELRSVLKKQGGLIKTSVVLDGRTKRIESVLFTGDFFVYPQNALFDLESLCKKAPAQYEKIAQIIREFFLHQEITVPGFGPEDFTRAVWTAVEKSSLARQGIDYADINRVFTVGASFHEIKNPAVLLLPYCAKKVTCPYRYDQGCGQCGECTVGDAFRIAEEYGLTPITIQNYEMLEETLLDLKNRQVSAFMGICCEAFYIKHKEDFERIGLPGILLDVDHSTCYDLGQETQAHQGKFENETSLKIGLLKQVLEIKISHRPLWAEENGS